MRKIAVLGATLACVASSVPAQPPAFDPAPIEQATGIKPTYNAKENVYKVTRPRPNLAAVDGWKLPPFLGTRSYAAFAPTGEAGKVMVMGDNVLYEDEVPAAMDAALQNGLEVTALHNHFFFEQPRLYFMHVGGMGAKGQNFYHKLATRYGYSEVADHIQDLFLSGRKAEAIAAVPDELVRQVNLIGPRGFVKERIAAFAEAGVTTLLATPVTTDAAEYISWVEELQQLLP